MGTRKFPNLGLRLRSPSQAEKLIDTLPVENDLPEKTRRRKFSFHFRHVPRRSRVQFYMLTVLAAFIFSSIIIYVKGTNAFLIFLGSTSDLAVFDTFSHTI